MVAFVEGLALLLIRIYFPFLGNLFNTTAILISLFVCTPLLIGLFFAAGRASMLPIPSGVHLMPSHACCSQGLVFPSPRVAELVKYFNERLNGQHNGPDFVDSAIERYADRKEGPEGGELRWALTPVLLQHVGIVSSKAEANVKKVGIWNYRFEANDEKRLREEHREYRLRVQMGAFGIR
jgi:hypothetical protein